ncbi:hypothetical protein JKP88DRAFT_226363 [Tribonema minus]|uniref:Vacuolar ATPase assembly protein VMA22 n=1 Tax=Tribonema minus TaxID=303371 RepID=A0A835YMR8_9STRA|nr:hypothetical protein JKP88DRAFT_226363 [Tribonema minus]
MEGQPAQSGLAASTSRRQCSLETSLTLALLEAADELHNAKAELSLCLKQGFFNMTKARLAAGGGAHSAGITVLDTREEFHAAVTVELLDKDPDASPARELRALKLPAGHAFQRAGNDDAPHSSGGSVNGSSSLRQRNHAGSDSSTIAEEAAAASAAGKDSMQLFGGLVPPALRKAKRNFSSALDYVFLAAELTQRVALLYRAVLQCVPPPPPAPLPPASAEQQQQPAAAADGEAALRGADGADVGGSAQQTEAESLAAQLEQVELSADSG